jgi:hypothetical protein
MASGEENDYAVGTHGWIEVLDFDGTSRHWVEGEVVRLITEGEDGLWALIRSVAGTVLCRLRGFPAPPEEDAGAVDASLHS